MARSSSTVKVPTPFLGVNTRLPDARLRSRDGSWLRTASNADLSAGGGSIRRREGYTLTRPASGLHSLWSDDDLGVALAVEGTQLIRINTDLSVTTLRTDMSPHHRVSYATVGQVVLYSNGIIGGRVPATGGHQDGWGGIPSEFLAETPMGNIVRTYKGRLLSVRGNTLYFSEPWAPGLYKPDRNFIPFDHPITVVVPLDTGVWVATDRDTFWLAGDIADTSVAKRSSYGATTGTDAPVPSAADGVWMTPRGLVRGSVNGEITALQEPSINAASASAGATFVRERRGTMQAISSLVGADPQSKNNTAVGSYMSAEVIRKGTKL